MAFGLYIYNRELTEGLSTVEIQGVNQLKLPYVEA